jgi:hypothetical protein
MVVRAVGQAGRSDARRARSPVAVIVEEARQAGLLDGDRAEHLSFRAPSALVEAAKRETGISSTTELGIAALAALAQSDPVAAFLRRTRGKLAGLPPIEP